ncbi:MAG: hypothetical protein DCC56_09705 [Anaerolineae bacterium]|nr:MAG: hypothetical protein DCC56_09705 [Anaerolineae bacterium]WKZ45137.1 MAG: glycosyltransferase family A protein [Anaerolineales bacterium]
MSYPLISIIIPAYNNAEYLGDAVRSVLNQTYSKFELILVNDASPDNTDEVVKRFGDPRIKYIVHDVNRGLSAARNTGIRNSAGDYIALLDGDDYYHTDKLKAHVEFFEQHPDVDITYNPRFELNHSSKTIRELWRPPASVNLHDLIFGFPFGPSDMIIKREAVLQVNMFDEYYVYVGEDLDFNCRLALAGYKFASVDRALNYRRYHSGRSINDIRYFVNCTLRALKSTFSDSRCPQKINALENQAVAAHYILWSAIAFMQNDTELGQEYCRAAVNLNPAFLSGQPNQLLDTLISYSIVDENLDHEELLHRAISQLPSELRWMADQTDWAIGRGSLWRFVRAVMWEREEDARIHYKRAFSRKATIDKDFLRQLSAQIDSYGIEFGERAAHRVIELLIPRLEKLGNAADVRWLVSHYLVNFAFRSYKAGEYASVQKAISRAVANNPSYLFNRGVIKIYISSLLSQAY